MTICITDRTTGESYDAESPKDCRDIIDAIGFCFAEAYGQTHVFGNTVYELIGGGHD